MTVDRDDPRLTAYALGELETDQERLELEALLRDDPEGQRLIEEIKQTAQFLTQELQKELSAARASATDHPAGGVETGQGDTMTEAPGPQEAPPAILKVADEPAPRVKPGRSRLLRTLAWGMAASLLLMGGLAFLMPSMRSARESARGIYAQRATVSRSAAPASDADLSTTLASRSEGRAEIDSDAIVALPGLETQLGSLADLASRSETTSDDLGLNEAMVGEKVEAAGAPGRRSDLGLSYRGAAVAPASGAVPATAAFTPAATPASSAEAVRLKENAGQDRFFVQPGMAGKKPSEAPEALAAVVEGGTYGSIDSVPAAAEPARPAIVPPPHPGQVAGQPAGPPMAAPAEQPVARGVISVRNEQEVLGRRLAEQEALRLRLLKRKLQDEERLRQQVGQHDREQYARINDNPFIRADKQPLSTFSIDVDTASYANVRRYLMNQSMLPPPDAVRIEEMVNYFSYDYPQPEGDKPFSVNVELARCPWNADHRLARIGLKGREIEGNRPASNLVFLIDVSGSMNQPDKLPLLKEGLNLLVEELTENDRVSIVVYASAEGIALEPTQGDQKAEIKRVIDSLAPGGSTHGSAGIQAAYDLAARDFVQGGTNRVILATDGDFNVGVTDDGSLERLIAEKAKSKVFLTVLGFGTGNLQDAKMETLADKGNGNYHYIDSVREARKVLVEEMGGTLVTIAKDVKIQVDFNPAKVGAYRLIGYENRMLQAQDFRDDKKDAGEIGAGHAVTAIYELIPPDQLSKEVPDVEPSKYVKPADAPKEEDGEASSESFTVRLRFKPPEGDVSTEDQVPVVDQGKDYADASPDFKWASAVAGFGMLLRDSPYKGTATLPAVLELAESGKGEDPGAYRAEFLEMVRKAQSLLPSTAP